MTEEKRSHLPKQQHYRITVEGVIPANWSDWLGGVQLVSKKEVDGIYTTTLSGALPDQAALRGLLNRLWDLNLVLRSVHSVDPAAQCKIEDK